MKRIILNIIFTASMFAANGQISAAFSESYTHEANKEYTKAIAAMDKVYDAASYSINLRLGWLNYLSGNYTKSQSYYNKAIGVESKSVEARLGLAYPLSAMGNWDDIIQLYEQILSIDPNNSLVNYRLASIYYTRKKLDKAAEYAQAVVKLYPFDYDANYLIGQIYIGQGKLKEAKLHLKRAYYYNPTSAEVKALLSKV